MRHHIVPLWNTIGVTVAIFEHRPCYGDMAEKTKLQQQQKQLFA